MPLRRKRQFTNHQATLPPQTMLWLLRILIPLGTHREFIDEHRFANEALACALGLGEWVQSPRSEFSRESILAALRKLHQACEASHHGKTPSSLLAKNVQRLSELVGLTESDRRILIFAATIHNDRLLDDAADWLGYMSSVKLFYVLSELLDMPEEQVRLSLSNQGILARSGLLTIDRKGPNTLSGKLDLLSNHFSDSIFSMDADPISLLKETVAPSSPSQLKISDFGHINPSLAMPRPYLKASVASGRKGVNIFIHGAPGTGKTQLAKVLAQDIGCDLFEVASEDSEGDAVNGERRLRAFRAAQSFFAQSHSLILFDEVEDVFNDGESMFGRRSTAQVRKAWINRMLEENPVPALWLSNSLRGLDPAFVRRFDMIFELPVPPCGERKRMLLEQYADLLDAPSALLIAESNDLAPAVLTKAASAVRSISEILGPQGAKEAFCSLIDSTLEAQGHKSIQAHRAARLP